MKKHNKSFFTPTDWVPLMAAILLAGLSVFGLLRLYLQGDSICHSLSPTERLTLSLKVNPKLPDHANNFEERHTSLYGSVATKDGQVLFDALHTQTNSPSFGSLIGYVKDLSVKDTAYILNHYQEEIFPTVSWNPVTGLERSCHTVQLTLDGELQDKVYQRMSDYNVTGCLVAYDYTTGDVKCLVSLPGWNTGGNGSYLNRCLYQTTPGSTMKLVTLLLLAEQDIDLEDLRFTCMGQFSLPDGEVVDCTACHGTINAADAIGVSCNCFFAQAIQMLDPVEAKATLRDLGFAVNDDIAGNSLGLLPVESSHLELSNRLDFHDVWQLIGQDVALVNPLHMALLAGNLAAGGSAALPRLTVDENTRYTSYSNHLAESCKKVYNLWQTGFSNHYSAEYYGPLYSAAKTGTADGLGADHAETHKLLCAVSEELHTAVFVVCENYAEAKVMPHTLASYAFKIISEQEATA